AFQAGPLFYPMLLINCIKVSRLWRQIMTPILWEMFDDQAMAHYKIPPHIVQAQSHHFRFLHVTCNESIPHPLKSQHLRRLVIANCEQLETFIDLIRRNSNSLTTVEWHVPDSANTPLKKELIQYSLETLTKLESLNLSRWHHCSVGQITRIAVNNPGLKELRLSETKNLEQSPGRHPSINITHLELNGQWEDNPGFIQLVKYCPKLESIMFWADASCPARALSKNLRENCPNLKSIESLNGDMAFCIGGAPTVKAVLQIVRASRGLARFDFPMNDLTVDICDALLELHADTLETIQLYLDGSDHNSLMGINRILSSCPNLTSLAVNNDQDEWSPEDAGVLTAEPWNCPKLKTWEVTGFSLFDEDYDEEDEYSDEEDEIDGEELDEKTMHGLESRAARRARIKANNAREEETFKAFLDKLRSHGWTVKDGYPTHPANDWKFLNVVIESVMDRVFTMPEMNAILLGRDFFFVKSAGAS
ncbi:hypothetical protein BGZ59_005853, partial [Podila verticillata]